MPSCRLIVGDVLDKLTEVPERSVHCCVTSPPFWGLRSYATKAKFGSEAEADAWSQRTAAQWQEQYGGPTCRYDSRPSIYDAQAKRWQGSVVGVQRWADGSWCEYGLEKTIDEYVRHTVQVFAAVRRVLRDDATLFVNMGDSYSQGNNGAACGVDNKQSARRFGVRPNENGGSGLRSGNLCNIPARFSLAMQDDGWILRSTIIWAKGLSLCPEYAGSVMPESVNGVRWERCRVKVKGCSAPNSQGVRGVNLDDGWTSDTHPETRDPAQWSDCPGCDKCKPNGGLVLRKGSWRPTSAYEFVFFFAKTADYYCDGDAVREFNNVGSMHSRAASGSTEAVEEISRGPGLRSEVPQVSEEAGGAGQVQQVSQGEGDTEAEQQQRIGQGPSCERGSQATFTSRELQEHTYGGRVGGDQNVTEGQMPLLPEAKAADDRSCNSTQQGRPPRQGEHCGGVPTVQCEQGEQGSDAVLAGRNLRNVWVSPPDGTPLATDVLVVNPQAFKAAHFATFPEKLVEPIIKAATSDKGVCPECGAPWARVIDSERVATRPTDTPYKDDCDEANKDHGRHVRESTTLGWRPTCGCGPVMDRELGGIDANMPIPATILDPFVGSGTTLLVARKLGRDSIGIELSPEYARMAEQRVADYAPLFTETVEAGA